MVLAYLGCDMSILGTDPVDFLRADHLDAGLLELGQLIGGGSAPKSEVKIDPCGLVAEGVPWILEPDGDGKIVFVRSWPVFPAGEILRALSEGAGDVSAEDARREEGNERLHG